MTSLNNPALPAETRKAMQEKVNAYKKTVARYESEPDTREGKKELIERARAHEELAIARSSRIRISTMARRCFRSPSC